MLSIKTFLTFLFAVLVVLLGPMIGWPMIISSSEVGLLFGVGLIVVARPRWALAIVLIAAMIDESRSVTPAGMHLVGALAGLGLAVVAHQKLLSGHSQTQVAVLVAVALLGAQVVFMLFRIIAILTRSDWLIPHIADTIQHLIPSLLWTGITTFIFWPMVRRRWVPLQRISSWI